VFNASYPQFFYVAGQNEKAEKLIAELLAKAKDELKYWESAYKAQFKSAQNSGDRAFISRLQQGAFLQNRPIQEQLYVMQELMNICKKYNPQLGASIEKELRDSQTMFIPNV
jgi:DNA polymerase II large subunit